MIGNDLITGLVKVALVGKRFSVFASLERRQEVQYGDLLSFGKLRHFLAAPLDIGMVQLGVYLKIHRENQQGERHAMFQAPVPNFAKCGKNYSIEFRLPCGAPVEAGLSNCLLKL